MLFETNKQKGKAGLAMAIAYFGSNGYNVSIPLNDTQEYDLVIEKNGIFQSVQCKACDSKKTSGSYEVSLKNTGGTKGAVYGRVCESFVDFVFILTGDKTMYLIPIDALKNNRSTVTVSKDNQYSQYIVNF